MESGIDFDFYKIQICMCEIPPTGVMDNSNYVCGVN